jgi:cell division septum initiation protein DivIVA
MSQGELIESLKSKVTQVIEDNRRLRERNTSLNRSLQRAKEEKAESQRRVAELERRVGVLELSASMGGNAQQKQLAKARVNRLMREVDKCIALIK